ncbi:MAG: DnaD domain protein [Dehalococcoidia bacterium]|nr:DnaD domain protein [Dehalococcoidia bacterium]MDW8119656.1 DnaD domain protein [Chloroflexota bacterium]
MPFDGFPARCTYTPVPSPLFGPLLEEIDDLAELKTLLRVVHLLHLKRGPTRAVSLTELAGDLPLARALGGDAQALERALQACVRRGVLTVVEVEKDGRRERLFLLNTPQGRAAAQRLAAGQGDVASSTPPPLEPPPPSNIYRLYEENIGVLTPLVADMLKDAEATYPPQWIAEAIQEAVRHNRRSWGYVEAILRRWAREGKGEHGAPGRSPQTDRAADLLRGRKGYGPLYRR